MNLEKTEVMMVGRESKDADVVDALKLQQTMCFGYLGGSVTEDAQDDGQAGVYRKVTGVKRDKNQQRYQ